MRAALLGLASLSSLGSLLGWGCSGAGAVDGGADTFDAPDAGDTQPVFDAPVFDVAHADLDARDALAFDATGLDATGPDAPGLDAPDLDTPFDALLALDAMDAPDVPSDAPITRMDDLITHPAAPPIAPFSTCTVTTSTDTISTAMHLVPCSPFDYPFLPPSAGPHFSIWANFGTYGAPVPWGFLVHSMEHGAVVLAYHCALDADCDAVRAEFQAILDDRGVDPICRDQDWPNRIIVVPDPTLPVPIAAVAWRNAYTATCLDPPSLRAFVDAHYGMATESLCAPGVDRSATGWCP